MTVIEKPINIKTKRKSLSDKLFKKSVFKDALFSTLIDFTIFLILFSIFTYISIKTLTYIINNGN
jgi:hypothetical protein